MAKPTRFGIAYIARRADGAWLLERRPDRGLLGGMLGWPGADWGDKAQADPPIAADWQEMPAEVRHTFTHFHLRLTIQMATVDQEAPPKRGEFVLPGDFNPSDLPTVMRKAFDVVRGEMLAD